jgi:hypothetical protein
MSTVEQALGGPAIEVVAKATRRRFTLEYKRKIVREADGGKTPGAVGTLLRREGLYSSHLATWPAARDQGQLAGAARRRSPVPRVPDLRDKRIAELERENARWRKRAERAEALVEVQKNIATEVGPRLGIASTCAAIGLPRATYYRRWSQSAPSRRRSSPRALSVAERSAVLAALHEPRFVDLAPAEVYATLLDEGRYLCSERTMYRLLAAHQEVRERRNQLRHPRYAAPELWPAGRTNCGAGTSPSSSGPRSGPTSTSTSCSTSSAGTSWAGW